MTTEDFSFPTENFPSLIESPPLWHLSPAASGSDSDDHQEETAKEEVSASSSKMVKRYENKKKEDEDEDDRDERMDLLWENFNDELSRSRSSSRVDSKSSSDRMVEVGCVHQALKLSRSRSKPPMVTVLKVLRKLFLLHNNSHHHHHNKLKTNRAW